MNEAVEDSLAVAAIEAITALRAELARVTAERDRISIETIQRRHDFERERLEWAATKQTLAETADEEHFRADEAEHRLSLARAKIKSLEARLDPAKEEA